MRLSSVCGTTQQKSKKATQVQQATSATIDRDSTFNVPNTGNSKKAKKPPQVQQVQQHPPLLLLPFVESNTTPYLKINKIEKRLVLNILVIVFKHQIKKKKYVFV